LHSESSSAQVWCLGVLATRTRSLTSAEADSAQELRTRSLRLALLLPVLSLLAPLGIGLTWLSLGFWIPIGGGLLALAPIMWIVGILASIDRYRRKRVLDMEMRRPVVAEFETVLDAADARKAAAIFGSSAATGPFRFAVVLSSGRVLSVQSQPPTKLIVLSSQLVASTSVQQTATGVGSRALSRDELQELGLRAASAWRTPMLNSIGYIAFACLAAWRGPTLFRSGWWHALPAAAFASVGVLSLVSVWNGYARSRRLRVDFERARVEIDRVPGADFVLERLPATKELWTIDGHPAPWRTASSVRRH
jgi:membrane protein YdbS with pleckstrin-like domain